MRTIIVTKTVKVEVDIEGYAAEYGEYPARTKDERDAVREDVQERIVESVRYDLGNFGWIRVQS